MKALSNQQRVVWEQFSKEHRRGEVISSRVSRIERDIGLFVDLGNDMTGIVHLSDLSWNSRGEKEVLAYNVGDEIKAVILSVEIEIERVSLGVKQLKPRPDMNQEGGPTPDLPVSPKNPKPNKPLIEAASENSR